jgi:hypothetical protein
VQIEEVRDGQRFERLRQGWSELHARAGLSNVYLAHEFVYTWWKHLGGLQGGCADRAGGLGRSSSAESLRVLVGTDGNRIVGVAPLQTLRVEVDGLPRPIRVLCLLGDVFLTRYRDFLVEAGREGGFVEAVWAHLCQANDPAWDAAFLGNLHEDSPTARLSAAALQRHAPAALRHARFRSKIAGGLTPENLTDVRAALREAAASRKLPDAARSRLESLAGRLTLAEEGAAPEPPPEAFAKEILAVLDEVQSQHPETREAVQGPAGLLRARLIDLEYPYVPLPSTWDDYKESLSGQTRRRLRRDVDKLARAGAVSYETVGTDFDGAAHFDDLARLHRCTVGERSLTMNLQTLDTQREVLEGCAARGWLSLSFLRLNGQRVAALACYDYGGRRYASLIGRDPSAPSSPGMVIIARAIEEAIALGLQELDLGPGHVRYKQHLTRSVRRANNLLVKKESVPLSIHDLAVRLNGLAPAAA